MKICTYSIGYLYCLSNPSMPSLFKIGLTTRTPIDRLKEANRGSTFNPPTPYELLFAKKVQNVYQKEKMIHTILSEHRVNPHREFFKTELADIKELFDSVDGEYFHLPLTDQPQVEFDDFVTWLDTHCVKSGKVSVRQLAQASGLDESTIKHFMKRHGYKYYNFRFAKDEEGHCHQGGYKMLELMYFSDPLVRP